MKKSVLILLHNKGSAIKCSNYRTIALTSHFGKVIIMILTERLRSQIEEHMADEQAGFRKNRSTVQQILILRMIAEKTGRKGKIIFNCFVDFQKAFDRTDQTVTWAVLESYGTDHQLVRLLRDVNENAQAAVRVCGQKESWFATSRGTRQGDLTSPTVFIADLERAINKVKNGVEGISVHAIKINNLRFADDIDIIAEDKNTLERPVHLIYKKAMRYGLVMNADKTKTLVFGDKQISSKICIDGSELEDVEKSTYLKNNMTYDLDCSKEIAVRIAMPMANFFQTI